MSKTGGVFSCFYFVVETTTLCMCRHWYVLRRTYFPDAHTIVRMEYGEFILHPGNLVHGGVDITSGERYLMVLFAHTQSP